MTSLSTAAQSATQHIDDKQVPVRLADELEQIEARIRDYVDLSSPDLAMLIAVWIANTYTFECFDYCGYLHIQSATPACGKTTLLKVIRYFSKGKPPILAAPTAAVVFRSQHAVILIDEAERLRDHDKENFGTLLTALNAGVEREGQVERLHKLKDGNYESGSFAVYRPKALAGIENIADTLESRSFHIRMQRAEKRPKRLRARTFEQIAQPVRQRLGQWAHEKQDALRAAYDRLSEDQEGLPSLSRYDDRFQDLAEPLVVLASLADEDRPIGSPILPRLMAGLDAAWGRRNGTPLTRENQLKAFVALARKRLGNDGSTFMSSSEVLSLCKEYPALADISSTSALAVFLRPFDLEPHSTGTVRGYKLTRVWLDQWSARYGCHVKRDELTPLTGGGGISAGKDEGTLRSLNHSVPVDPNISPVRVSGLSVMDPKEGGTNNDQGCVAVGMGGPVKHLIAVTPAEEQS